MANETQELLVQLRQQAQTDDFLEVANTLIDRLEESSTEPMKTIEALLHILEDFPETDFGAPGPIVHYAERFFRQGYEAKLVESLQRRPTPHTLWMLNRVLNGVEGSEKLEFIEVLDSILVRPDLDSATRQEAEEFRALHE